MEKVVIIHFGRVGSTVLSELLNQTPEIFSAGEIYNDMVNNFTKDKGMPWHHIHNDYLDFLDTYYLETGAKKANLLTKKKYFVFEYKPHLGGCIQPIEQVFSDFTQKGIKYYIFLYRKNYLRRLVSVLISFETGVWHINQSRTKIHQVHIDLNKIKDGDIGIIDRSLIDALNCYYQYVTRIKKQIELFGGISLSFEEDIAENPCCALKKVCDFLMVKPINNPQISLKRQNPALLQEIILNFTEVKNYLENSEFQLLLKE